MSASPAPSRVDRRRFLATLGKTGAGALVFAAVPAGALGLSPMRKVYRRSARGHTACNACRGHTANRYYFNKPEAQRDLPHLGCTCRVLDQWITKEQHERYFNNPHGKPRKIFDVRWEG